jgi:hypothetical protein
MLALPLHLFSQYLDLPIINQKGINRVNKKVNKSFNKFKRLATEDSLKLITFYQLNTWDTISSEEFGNGYFLKKLSHFYCQYRSKKKPWLCVDSYICSSDKKVIAIFDNIDCCFEYLGILYALPSFYDFIEYIWDKPNHFVFRMASITNFSTFFMVNEQFEISVFYEESNRRYNVLPLKEYVDQNWKRLSEGSMILKN